MFQRILVPLDGSPLAEQALPIAARIARATGGTVILLHVAPLHVEYGPYLAQAPSLSEVVLQEELAHAESYLARVANAIDFVGIKTETETIFGIPAQTILTFAHIRKVDLIVMCSHGYTGFKRWAVGSVARKIVQQSAAPVLLLREGSPTSEKLLTGAVNSLHAVVALDGSSFAEASLEPVAQLVAALSAPLQGQLHLVRVVKRPHEQEYTLHDAELQERAAHEATVYLSALESELHAALAAELGVKITYSVVVSEDVADALIRTAELGDDAGTFQACDMLALATHGRSGLERWMLGSVMKRVLDGTKLPLLIVRPQEQHTRATLEPKEKAAVGS
jgi:nucleotide-binding universal stress UspA family protein